MRTLTILTSNTAPTSTNFENFVLRHDEGIKIISGGEKTPPNHRLIGWVRDSTGDWFVVTSKKYKIVEPFNYFIPPLHTLQIPSQDLEECCNERGYGQVETP